MSIKAITLSLIAVLSVIAYSYYFTPITMSEEQLKPAAIPEVPAGYEQIALGAGCFWCVEAVYNRLDGIKSAVSGYTAGHTKNPTYKDICRGGTGHNEVVHIVYNPQVISTSEILDWFWKLHNPTTLNRQGNDVGDQYRSGIYFYTEAQKQIAEESLKKAQPDFEKRIVTEIKKIATFYPAEIGHQDYYYINKNRDSYCRAVITPKIKKLNLHKKDKVAE